MTPAGFSEYSSSPMPLNQRARHSLPFSTRAVSRHALDSDDNKSLLLGPSPQTLAKQAQRPELVGLSHKLQGRGFGPLPFPPPSKLISPYGDIARRLSNNITETNRLSSGLLASEQRRSRPLNTSSIRSLPYNERAIGRDEKQAVSRVISPERAVLHEAHCFKIHPARAKRPRHSKSNTPKRVSEPHFPPVEYSTYTHLQSYPRIKGDEPGHKVHTLAGDQSSSSQHHAQDSSAGKRARQSGSSPSRRKRPTKSGGRSQSSGTGRTNQNEDEDGEESETNNSNEKVDDTKPVRSRKVGIYACPFSKHDKESYEECCGHSLGAYHQVFNHIKRKHKKEVPPNRWQCYQCKAIFDKCEEWSEHKLQQCKEKEDMLVPTIQLLHDKIRRGTNEEKWAKMYGFLFPGEEASPYTWFYDLRQESLRQKQAIEDFAKTITQSIMGKVINVLGRAIDEVVPNTLAACIDDEVVSSLKQQQLLDLHWVNPSQPPAYDLLPRPESFVGLPPRNTDPGGAGLLASSDEPGAYSQCGLSESSLRPPSNTTPFDAPYTNLLSNNDLGYGFPTSYYEDATSHSFYESLDRCEEPIHSEKQWQDSTYGTGSHPTHQHTSEYDSNR